MPSIAANRQMEPQKLGRFMKGELDWMVMKALSKERDRRYETANGFAKDIERYLNNEPVAAGPPSASYRLRKFVRRNRGQVIAASLVLVALLAGVAGTTLGLIEARRQEAVAKRQETLANERAEGERLAKQKAIEAADGERLAKLDAQEQKALAEQNEKKALAAAEEEKKAKETVEDVLGFVETKVFAAARPKGQAGGLGYDVKLADAVTAALPSIDKGFPDKPLTEARLRRTIGSSFHYLGKPELAREQLEAARSIYSRQLGPDHPTTLRSMNNVAFIYDALGRHAEAVKLHEETLALAKAKLGPDHPLSLSFMGNLARSYDALGRNAEAVKLNEETLALTKVKLGPDHPTTLRSMEDLALIYYGLGRNAEAVKLNEETVALMKAKLGPDHPDTLKTINNLALSHAALGRHAEAAKLHEETLVLMKAKLGPDHPDTLIGINNLARSYDALGRHAEALKLNEETLALKKAKLGPDHPTTLVSMNNLANSYSGLGRHAEALKLFEETLALTKAKLGPDHPYTLTSMSNVAYSYGALGRNAEALKLNEETLALKKAKLGPDHPDTLTSMNNLARSYDALGRNAEALKLNEETLALMKAKLGPDHPDTLVSMGNLANSYSALGNQAEALKLNEETLALMKAKLGLDHPYTLTIMSNLASNYLAAGRTTEALSLLAQSSIANPKDTALSLKVAAWQAWFGQEKELAATRQRILATAEGTDDVLMADRAAKACSILPSADRKELDAAIVLARRAVDLGKDHRSLQFFLMALGMAEYRGGNFAEAEVAHTKAMDRGKGNLHIAGTSAFYRAMSLFRQGKIDEARELATEATSKMKPLPADEKHPLAGGANADDLILWLAYKEAKALIGFDAPSALSTR